MLTPFQPDAEYCVYCHAEAAGPCATCQAMVCADCSEVTGGSVKRVAVCRACYEAGAGSVGWRSWWPVLKLLVVVVGGLLALGLLLEVLS